MGDIKSLIATGSAPSGQRAAGPIETQGCRPGLDYFRPSGGRNSAFLSVFMGVHLWLELFPAVGWFLSFFVFFRVFRGHFLSVFFYSCRFVPFVVAFFSAALKRTLAGGRQTRRHSAAPRG